jgi:uncharacterized membrane protein (DUF2068 family)
VKSKKYEGNFRVRFNEEGKRPTLNVQRSTPNFNVYVERRSLRRRENAILFSPPQCEGTIGDVVPAKKRSHSHGDGALLVIAIFKFVKGAVLLALAFGALTLLHKDVASEVEYWLDQLRIDPDNEFIGALLNKLQLVHTKELKEISALGASYAALFLTEGTGLLFRKRWAEWLTIVATSSLMPMEVYELVKKFTAVRLLALLINAAVVLYLSYLVREKEKQQGGSKHA